MTNFHTYECYDPPSNPVRNHQFGIEIWKVKIDPASATLSIVVRDKDLGATFNNYIGKFQTSASSGPKEVEMQVPMNVP
ncbi:hypothetical protein EDD17DRAFT_1675894 [Pisolithus thermaeus]|nr:hypothetical protein EDD17DRAFT_1675894 [Pisolithus thermaeus]